MFDVINGLLQQQGLPTSNIPLGKCNEVYAWQLDFTPHHSTRVV
jgi:hypothetical protein